MRLKYLIEYDFIFHMWDIGLVGFSIKIISKYKLEMSVGQSEGVAGRHPSPAQPRPSDILETK